MQMTRGSRGARSDDTQKLAGPILELIVFEEGAIIPPVPFEDKVAKRGFQHPMFARLLCPVEMLRDFDADPEGYVFIMFLISLIFFRFRVCILSGKVTFTSCDYPACLYDLDIYDGEDPQLGLLRSPLLVRVCRLNGIFCY